MQNENIQEGPSQEEITGEKPTSSANVLLLEEQGLKEPTQFTEQPSSEGGVLLPLIGKDTVAGAPVKG